MWNSITIHYNSSRCNVYHKGFLLGFRSYSNKRFSSRHFWHSHLHQEFFAVRIYLEKYSTLEFRPAVHNLIERGFEALFHDNSLLHILEYQCPSQSSTWFSYIGLKTDFTAPCHKFLTEKLSSGSQLNQSANSRAYYSTLPSHNTSSSSSASSTLETVN